jgi:hypothetical protein
MQADHAKKKATAYAAIAEKLSNSMEEEKMLAEEEAAERAEREFLLKNESTSTTLTKGTAEREPEKKNSKIEMQMKLSEN